MVKKLLQILFSTALIVLLCIYPQEGKTAIIDALRTCGCSVIPALFPFFVGSKLLISLLSDLNVPKFLHKFTGRIFGVDGNCISPLILSFCGGYPVGVSSVVCQYKNGIISKQDAERALLFCNNSGPGFFIAVVSSTVLGSIKQGLLLYFVHVISALLIGRFFAKGNQSSIKIKRMAHKSTSISSLFLESISDTCEALLKICGLILFFSLLLSFAELTGLIPMLETLFPHVHKPTLSAIVYGIFELTGAVLRLGGSPAAFPLAALFMGWGGLCVHFQAMSLWQGAGLHPKAYFFAKLLHGAISFFFASCLWIPSIQKTVIFLFCVFILILIPEIRKKVGGNSLRYAL